MLISLKSRSTLDANILVKEGLRDILSWCVWARKIWVQSGKRFKSSCYSAFVSSALPRVIKSIGRRAVHSIVSCSLHAFLGEDLPPNYE